MIEKSEYYVNSTNGKNKLHVIMWQPVEGTRAILQISHGMAEYIDRYDRMASWLASNGILVIGNDHLGHGESVNNEDELGYFNTKKLSATVVADLYKVTTNIRARYRDVPFIILGHSMGSFLVRRYLMTYPGMADGAIIMGTGGQAPGALKAAKTIADSIGAVKGDHYRSKALTKLAFGTYNKRIKPARTEFDWLSVNTENVDTYIADPLCGFMFTINGYKTLFDVLSFIQEKKNIEKLPKNIPMLFISGEEDPVGSYGKDVKAVAGRYAEAGVKDIKVKLFPGDRHEIHNEADYQDVHVEILKFIRKVMKEKRTDKYQGSTNHTKKTG